MNSAFLVLVILWAGDFTVGGLACISKFGPFDFHFRNYFSSAESYLLPELLNMARADTATQRRDRFKSLPPRLFNLFKSFTLGFRHQLVEENPGADCDRAV